MYLRVCILLVVVVSSAFSTIDDDWCDDRVNGSDEKLSSACSWYLDKATSTCLDRQWVTQRVFSSRVGDGICDCCDGSDEEKGICGENSCESLGSSLKERKRSSAEAQVKGLAAKAAIIEKTRKRFDEMQDAVSREAKEGPILDQSIRVLEETIVVEEKVEANEVMKLAASATTVFKREVELLAESIASKESMIDWIAAMTIRCKEDATEVIAASLPMGGKLGDVSEAMIIALEAPSTKDGDLKLKEGSAEELVMNVDGVPVLGPIQFVISKTTLSGSLLKDMKEALALTPSLDQAVLVDVLAASIQEAQAMEVLLLSALDANVFPDLAFSQLRTLLASIPDSARRVRERGHRTTQGDALREELSAARTNREELRALASSANVLQVGGEGVDLGPDKVFLHLVNRCFRKRHGSYHYSACPFKEAHQSNVLLGRFQGFSLKPTKRSGIVSGSGGGDGGHDGMLELSDALKAELGLPSTATTSPQSDLWMVFTGGSFCPAAGRSREMHVKMECSASESEELSGILEPETCFYMATLMTPLAC